MPFPGASCSSSSDDDRDLIARAKLRDPGAVALLYRRYVDPIYRYCYRRLENREAAEDATSQTFMQALAALPQLREQPFRAWLFAIAHNVIADVHRSHRATASLSVAADVVARDPTPEEWAMATEQDRALRALLTQVSSQQRQLLELRLAGLSGKEIAAVLGCSDGAVRTAQYRLVRRLRAIAGADLGIKETLHVET